MASGAPDWERIVTIVADVEMGVGAPDWVRIVVGPGGVPIGGGGLTYVTTSATQNADVAPGTSATMCGFNLPDTGFWLVLAQVASFWPATPGTYGWIGYLQTNNDAGIVLGGGSTYDQRDIAATEAEFFYTYPMFGALVQADNGSAGVSLIVGNAALSPADLHFVGPATPNSPQCYMIGLKIG